MALDRAATRGAGRRRLRRNLISTDFTVHADVRMLPHLVAHALVVPYDTPVTMLHPPGLLRTKMYLDGLLGRLAHGDLATKGPNHSHHRHLAACPIHKRPRPYLIPRSAGGRAQASGPRCRYPIRPFGGPLEIPIKSFQELCH